MGTQNPGPTEPRDGAEIGPCAPACLTPDDMTDLLALTTSHRNRALLALWWDTSITAQQLVSLNVGHVHLFLPRWAGEVHVPTPLSEMSPRGVDYVQNLGKWRARVGEGYSKVHLGYFPSRENAERAVKVYRAERIPPRAVSIAYSVPYILPYLNGHAQGGDPAAPLFPSGGRAGGGRLSVRQAQKVARIALGKLGFRVPIGSSTLAVLRASRNVPLNRDLVPPAARRQTLKRDAKGRVVS